MMITENSTLSIRVWVRSLGNACRVRVDKEENLHWLVERLSRHPEFAQLKQLDLNKAREKCLFHISNYSESRPLAHLEETLSQIPGVHLMTEPEYK
jgi:hypothetical protein